MEAAERVAARAEARVHELDTVLGELLVPVLARARRAALEAGDRIQHHFDEVRAHRARATGGLKAFRHRTWHQLSSFHTAQRGLRQALGLRVCGVGRHGQLLVTIHHEPGHGGWDARQDFLVGTLGFLDGVLDTLATSIRPVRFELVATEHMSPTKCRMHITRAPAWLPRSQTSASVPPLRTGRHAHGSAHTAAGMVFVVGGFGDSGYLSAVERFSVEDGVWAEVTNPLPTARSECAACTVGKFLVVAGGIGRAGGSASVDVYATEEGVWRSAPPLPEKLRGFAMASWNGTIFVVGGFNGRTALSTVWALDVEAVAHDGGEEAVRKRRQPPSRWCAWPPLASARRNLGGAAGTGMLFACGGAVDMATTLRSCECLDVQKRRWSAMPDMPTPRRSCGCAFGGGNVFVAGGYDRSKRLSSVEAFAVCSLTWSTVGELGVGRGGCSAACVGRRLLVFGGSGRSAMRTCEAFVF